mmetsp:Transcript_50234/g.92810  ORF Transcript_50234/g.92810 Transcript_50234/m.92810 type:complete len:203 (+) Transcript_50234:115-723(+)
MDDTAERKVWPVYAQSGYDSQLAKQRPQKDDPLIVRRKKKYEREGMRRTVQAVLLVHMHGHPHVLALSGRSDGDGSYRLPGGTLQPGESEREGLNRKLKRLIFNADPTAVCEWKVGELMAIWWRPSFDDVAYPYLPPHVTRPKECVKIYQVTLPAQCVLAVVPEEKLVAVPFFDLFGDAMTYGPVLGSIPQLVSTYALAVYE